MSPSSYSSPARWSPTKMPSEDPTIGPFEDAVASWARTPGSAEPLIGHPLSLQPIRESPRCSPGSLPLPRARRQRAAGHRCPYASISLLSGTA